MGKAIILLISVLAFAIAPFVVPPFMGYDPSAFPIRIERHPIQPAGWAFSIWGVIYLWLVIHAGYGVWQRATDPVWDRPRLPLALSALIGTVWMSIAAASPIWGTVTIWPMAIAAIIAFLRADPVVDRLVLAPPIAMLAGWLTAAASVSTGVLLAGYGLMAPVVAAAAMLVLVLVITLAIQRMKPRQPIYGLTVVWALTGIIAVNISATPTVAILAAGGIVVVLTGLVLLRRA
ncbi:MAG: hypothetical protein WAT09_04705 [Paracoccaceae bacterium]